MSRHEFQYARSNPDEPIETILTVLAEGWLTAPALRTAVDAWRGERPKIGRLALQNRLLTVPQVTDVLEDQAECRELFGLIAVRKGYLTQQELATLLQLQQGCTPPLCQYLLDQGKITPEQFQVLLAHFHTLSDQAREILAAGYA